LRGRLRPARQKIVQKGISCKPAAIPQANSRDAQLDQLRAAGCSSRNIDREKVMGAHSDRCELLRMLDRLAPGDVWWR